MTISWQNEKRHGQTQFINTENRQHYLLDFDHGYPDGSHQCSRSHLLLSDYLLDFDNGYPDGCHQCSRSHLLHWSI
jgi:hypothetical protein